ncbi:MAG TPA: hypothetical protein VFU28_20415 [Vicinamibacterales bacterium]|nr:hypothetical protein [Vicinamibacterales bacterium]
MTGTPLDFRKLVMELLDGMDLESGPVPPSERTELPIPATLEHLVLACLAKNPEERPQNARQLAQSLDTIVGMAWDEEQAVRWWSQHHPAQASTSDAIAV